MSSAPLTVSPLLKRILHWGGRSLALIGIVFVACRLRSYWLDLDLSRITPSAWSLNALLAVIYGSANVLLALAWWHLLRYLRASATIPGAIRIYGVSQLAKYVPGNIFHLAGRQALGMAAGLPAAALAKSTIWELGSIAVAGSLFGWLVLPLVLPGFSLTASVLFLSGSIAVIAFLLRRIVGRQPVWAFISQLFFLLISGTVFVALLDMIVGEDGLAFQHWLPIGGAYIVAWLIGLVTPGAPAGVGVREMVLLLLLKGLVAEMDLFMAVLLGRLVTVVGDLLFFMATSSIPAKLCVLRENHV